MVEIWGGGCLRRKGSQGKKGHDKNKAIRFWLGNDVLKIGSSDLWRKSWVLMLERLKKKVSRLKQHLNGWRTLWQICICVFRGKPIKVRQHWKAKTLLQGVKFKYQNSVLEQLLWKHYHNWSKSGLKKNYLSYLKREIHHCDKFANTIHASETWGSNMLLSYDTKGAFTYIQMLCF